MVWSTRVCSPADYSQIEMRIMVHLAADEKLIAAYEAGEDLHRYVAALVHGIDVEDVTAQQRSHVKAMSYGLATGCRPSGWPVSSVSTTPTQQI